MDLPRAEGVFQDPMKLKKSEMKPHYLRSLFHFVWRHRN
jgi:hypothetical protein